MDSIVRVYLAKRLRSDISRLAFAISFCALALLACRPTTERRTIPPSAAEGSNTSGTPLMTAVSGDPNHVPTAKASTQQLTDSPTKAKFRILERFPNVHFCDPDSFPVARITDSEQVRNEFATLQENPEEFQAILAHNELTGRTDFTDEQIRLIQQQHKMLGSITLEAIPDGYRFELRTQDDKNSGFLVHGTLTASNTLSIQQQEPIFVTCPRCLSHGTQIGTPQGSIAVENLRLGDTVWTVDGVGTRQSATILKTTSVPVPSEHRMLRITLADGRELLVSPGHPTTDGRPVRALLPGDVLSGAAVVNLEYVSYPETAIYDILPSGDTGFYWANQILIGSTLITH